MSDDFGDNIIKCPMLEKEIFEALCLDINLVRTESAKPSILAEKIDLEKAKENCPSCLLRPL
ncbi:MAG: hypothetical protein C4589_08655 [Peptococcaceae bacterium]|nr:MAG: hypothetical protein C4589_08655 [Peptococcaceae bacterium]